MPEFENFCFVEESLPTRPAISFVSKEGEPVDDMAKRKVIAQISGTVALKKISTLEAVDLITDITIDCVNRGNESIFSAVYNAEKRAIDAYMETLAEKVTEGFITTEQYMEEYRLTHLFAFHEEFHIVGRTGLASDIAPDGTISPWLSKIDEYSFDPYSRAFKMATELNLTHESSQTELIPGTSLFNSGRNHISLGVMGEDGYDPKVTILNSTHPSFDYR